MENEEERTTIENSEIKQETDAQETVEQTVATPAIPVDAWKEQVHDKLIEWLNRDGHARKRYILNFERLMDEMVARGLISGPVDYNSIDPTYWQDIIDKYDNGDQSLKDLDKSLGGKSASACLRHMKKFADAIQEELNKGTDINNWFSTFPSNAQAARTRRAISLNPRLTTSAPLKLSKNVAKNNSFDSSLLTGQNLIVYGNPGCGKSYYVSNDLLNSVPEDLQVRTTFYQDYTNTDFVGQLLPKADATKALKYQFNPGPFTRALVLAIENPNDEVALVIDEINRGNAPSIFGDIFQLLDRDNFGRSEYGILNVNITDYLNEHFKKDGLVFNEVRIPSNLSIYATMNTSDQNVYTLDTAFKRRWDFEKIKNVFKAGHKLANLYIPGTDTTWKKFVETINKHMVEDNSIGNEDKQIGTYFMSKNLLSNMLNDKSDPYKIEAFAYKMIGYLWDDVAKFNREEWFGNLKTLDEVIDKFIKDGLKVFANVTF